MEIDLGNEVVITVKVNGNSYSLREPTQSDIEKLQEREGENDSHAFFDFVAELGMPKEVINSLGIIRLKKLAEGLTGVLTEKK